MMDEELNPTEDHVIDVLLVEALDNAGPPDLSNRILARFHNETDAPAIVHSTNRKIASSTTSKHNPMAIMVASIAVLAACFLAIIWIRGNSMRPGDSISGGMENSIASSDQTPAAPAPRVEDDDVRITSNDSRQVERVIPGPGKKARGIPLAISEDSPSSEHLSEAVANQKDEPSQPPEKLTLVSRQVESDLRAYWQAIGIQPSGEAEAGEIVQRLKLALGVDFSGIALDDPQQTQTKISHSDVARAVAASWLDHISERTFARVAAQDRNELVNELATCFESQQAFDRLLVKWLNGQNETSSAFFEAVGMNGRRADSAVTKRLAALTMNVDLRCIECHDSYIAGDGRQEDYWAFAGLLRRGINRNEQGQMATNSKQVDRPVFYELPDGRQRIAQPGVSTTWMNTRSPMTNVRQWTNELVGSPELARGVVNSLWQMVHGQTLSGRVVDPISPPQSESLQQLETRLAKDLMASKFNVARTLSVIIASPVTRRAIPESLLPENALVASEADRRSAMNSVDAFAAAMPPHTRLSLSDRLTQSMRAIGAKLDTDSQSFVGQVGDTSASASRDRSRNKSLAADFPDQAETFPVQWLGSIENETDQIKHLGYLAGVNKVPASVFEASETMQLSKVSDELRLHRIWWMIRP